MGLREWLERRRRMKEEERERRIEQKEKQLDIEKRRAYREKVRPIEEEEHRKYREKVAEIEGQRQRGEISEELAKKWLARAEEKHSKRIQEAQEKLKPFERREKELEEERTRPPAAQRYWSTFVGNVQQDKEIARARWKRAVEDVKRGRYASSYYSAAKSGLHGKGSGTFVPTSDFGTFLITGGHKKKPTEEGGWGILFGPRKRSSSGERKRKSKKRKRGSSGSGFLL